MQEEFRDIEGFENYQVSNLGNVKNISTGIILNFNNSVPGPYYRVDLCKDSIIHTKPIHVLVAKAFIPNPENKLCIDHIDTDKTNNNANNLRYATKGENNRNRGIQKNNSSGYKGVYYDKRYNKWTAKIGYQGKPKHLGQYEKKEDALIARLKAVIKYHGDYANKIEKDLIINLNIKNLSKQKIVVNINIENTDDDYKALEQELDEIIKGK